MPGSYAGLSRNHLEKDGTITKEMASHWSFLATRYKSEKGWRRAQVHQNRMREDLGLFRGLGLVFKDLSRAIKQKRQEKGLGHLLFCLVPGLAEMKRLGFSGSLARFGSLCTLSVTFP